MSIKDILCFLTVIPIAISACNKDADYRDKYEGIYNSEIIGTIIIIEPPISIHTTGITPIIVQKGTDNTLQFIFSGESITGIIDDKDNLTFPDETGTAIEIDPETGAVVEMTFTATYVGIVTGRTIHIEKKYSGTATVTIEDEKFDTPILGEMAYNGVSNKHDGQPIRPGKPVN